MSTVSNPPGVLEILRGTVGSRAYGTDTLDSDTDYMSVVVPPRDCIVGLKQWGQNGTVTERHDYPVAGHVEHTLFELRKFVSLCIGFNPNVIPLLWLPPRCYVEMDQYGRMLVHYRTMFNSKKAYYTLSGFARGQLRRMGGTFNNNVDPVTGRMGAKRKEIREKYGYDTKSLAHTIRLTRMCVEFLKNPEEGLKVDRSGIDAGFLRSIRDGALTQEQGKELAESLFAEADDALKTTTLPDEPNLNAINEIVMEIVMAHISK